MDNTVIILIGAGVSCVVIGFALFIKLLRTSAYENEDGAGNKKLLDSEYAENFQECFENTGNVEDTLEQLADIYTDDQYMYNLIVNAIDYIKSGQGDYETALEGINVDSDMSIMKMHNNAIKKALNLGNKDTKKVKKDKKDVEQQEETKAVEEVQAEQPEPVIEDEGEEEYEEEEEYDEDEEETEEIEEIPAPEPIKPERKEKKKDESVRESIPAPSKDSRAKTEAKNMDYGFQSAEEDDDLDDFKIG